MDWWLTFLSGTGAGAAVLYLGQRLFEHRLAKSLSAETRYFAAAQRFRDELNTAMAMFQPAHVTWNGGNQNAAAMRHFVKRLDVPAREFAKFKGDGFTKKWEETKNYCSTVLVHEILSKDPDRSNKSRDIFLAHVSDLMSHANPT